MRLLGDSGERMGRRVTSNDKKGFTLALLANLIWGTSFLASKITLSVWGPITAAAIRFAIALACLAIVLPPLGYTIKRPTSRAAWLQILAIGLSGFGILYPAQLAGLETIPSSLSASIMLTSPLFVLMLTASLLKEDLSPIKMISLCMGMTGGVILMNPASYASHLHSIAQIPEILQGSLLTFVASLCLAISVVFTRKASTLLDSASITFWSMCVGELLLVPLAIMEDPVRPMISGPSYIQAIVAMIYLSVFCSVVAFLIWNEAIKETSPQQIASTMHLKTPVALISGLFLAGESMSANLFGGTILIGLAVILSQWSPKSLKSLRNA